MLSCCVPSEPLFSFRAADYRLHQLWLRSQSIAEYRNISTTFVSAGTAWHRAVQEQLPHQAASSR